MAARNLRQQMQEQVGFKITNTLWKRIKDLGLIDDVRSAQADGDKNKERKALQELRSSLRQEYAESKRIVAIPRHVGGRVPISAEEKRLYDQLDSDTTSRAQAMRDYVAQRVRRNRMVKRFRRNLGDGTRVVLTDEQAYTLLSSEAASRLSFKQFHQLRIPIIGHQAKVLDEGNQAGPYGDLHWSKLFIDPPGDTFVVRIVGTVISECLRHPADQPLSEFKPTVNLDMRDAIKEAIDEQKGGVTIARDEYDAIECGTLVLPWEEGDDDGKEELALGELVEVWPYSVLDDLRRLSASLAEDYPWNELQAQWFLLTDKAPTVLPVRERRPNNDFEAAVTLQILPWVSSKTIEKIYHGIQHERLGRDNRALNKRTLDVFSCVSKQKKPPSTQEGWRKLCEVWNASHELMEQFNHPSRFKQYYEQALRVISGARRHHSASKPAETTTGE